MQASSPSTHRQQTRIYSSAVNEYGLFRISIKVRHYELDTLGHLNHAVYHQYAEVARLELFEAARGGAAVAHSANVGPVLLESHISFRKEIRGGETVDVTCDAKFGSGKTFTMDSVIYKSDDTLAAEISGTLGLMDLERRRLIDDPRGWFERAGADMRILSRAE